MPSQNNKIYKYSIRCSHTDLIGYKHKVDFGQYNQQNLEYKY